MERKVLNSEYIDLGLFPETEEIFSWIEDLSRLPHRRTGTAEGAKAAQYVAEKFKSFGLTDVRIENYPALSFEPITYSLKICGEELPCFFINGTLRKAENGVFETGENGLDKEIIYLGEGRKADFDNADVKDKIVICDCPWFDMDEAAYAREWCKNEAFVYDPDAGSREKTWKTDSYSPNAWPYNYLYACDGGAAGFVGVLVSYFDDGINWNEDYSEILVKYGYDYMELPGLWVGKSCGEKIKKMIETSLEPVKASIVYKCAYEMRDSNNVVGMLPGKSSDTILVHSHHDAVFRGAVQDASGMSEVFALAKYFAQIPFEKREKTLMFAGLDGHYTDYGGHQGFLKKRKEEGVNIILDVVIEHIGKEVTIGEGNKPLVMEVPELRLMYVSGGKELEGLAKEHIVKNDLRRMVMLPVNPVGKAQDDVYEFQQDEVISDAYWSHRYGCKIISMLSPQMYLFHPMDTPEMIPKEELRPVGVTFAELVERASKLDAEQL